MLLKSTTRNQSCSLPDQLQQAIKHHKAGELLQAEQFYRAILENQPNHPDVNHNLGMIAVTVNKSELALPFFKLALETDPNQAQFWLSYIDALIQVEQFDLASDILWKGRAMGLNGAKTEDFATYLDKIKSNKKQNSEEPSTKQISDFTFLFGQNYYVEAEALARELTTYFPKSGIAWKALAAVIAETKSKSEALLLMEKAANFLPNDVEIHNNISCFLTELSRFEEAKNTYIHALKLKPKLPITHYYFSKLLKLTGQYKQGWAEYLWFYHPQCIDKSKPPIPNTSKPPWQGESLQNKTILIFNEQGFGDMIQFVRYAELLKMRGATVFVMAKPALVEIFKTILWIDGVVECDAHCEFDFWAFPMQLPHWFETTLETIPCNVPYMSADKIKSAWWRDWLNTKIPIANKRVGLVWAGNPEHSNDAKRSLSFSQLAVFSGLKNVSFVSLQLGKVAQNAVYKGLDNMTILDASVFIHDFSDSAALLKNLDLLITVDSAPAHLAGALNLPVWVIITAVPDWRWLLERHDSPWYSSMRLFRQPKTDDWTSVLVAVKMALIEQVGS
jgi:tetratricopeptide (TPR) repeat protein